MLRLVLLLFITPVSLSSFISCSEKTKERKIEFVEPIKEPHTQADSLLIEMEGLMQQYAALCSRAENGEDVSHHMQAISAKMQDFYFKVEIVMHDLNPDEQAEFMDRCSKFFEMMDGVENQ